MSIISHQHYLLVIAGQSHFDGEIEDLEMSIDITDILSMNVLCSTTNYTGCS